MLWRAVRSPLASPPGLGMSWEDAVNRNPQQLAFLLADEKTILAMGRKMRVEQQKADGIAPEDVKRNVKEYMRELRKTYTGKSTRDDWHTNSPKRVTGE